MKISYIVSTYRNPEALACCLASLNLQTDRSFEIIVVDNSASAEYKTSNESVLKFCIRHDIAAQLITCNLPTCYHSSELGAKYASGQFLCFPSDDSYYVPKFAQVMLKKANEESLDLVYCNMVYDERCGYGRYAAIDVKPTYGYIDKTGFLLKRSKFVEFPGKPSTPSSARCDGDLIESLIAGGIRHGKVVDVLLVHN